MKLSLKECFTKDKILPLSLTAFIILLDQITKAIIAINYPIDRFNIIAQVFNNDFLQIIHVRNPAIAFSLGHNLPDFLKPVIFVIVPILVLIFLVWYYLKTDEFTKLQRWAAAGIIGGGFGNIIDRIFRPEGVVDFIDVKFYGLFGWERWPTFNFADASVVVCCLLLLVTMFFTPSKTEKKDNKKAD
ncbi:MAG: signal peptidase II [Treponema sp.]|nr:signal peptidase II [Treponema sp.]